MDDKESKSPWGQLAQDLGAKPSSKAFERKQPPAIEIPTTEQDEAPEEPQQAASDWNALAGSLGLEVPESSQPETESSPPAAEIEPAEEPEPVEEVAASSESASNKDSFGTGISSELDNIESDNLESDDADECYADEDEDEDVDDEATESLPPLPSEVDQIMSEGDWDSQEVTDKAVDETSDDDQSSDEDDDLMSALTAKNAFDALFSAKGSALAIPPTPKKMSEERSLDAELSADSGDAEASTGNLEEGDSEEGDKEERPKRKRSRRRRGRGRGRKSEAEQTSDEETSSEESVDDQDAELNGEDREESSREDSSGEDEKPRRRRPRRRSRRSASADSSKDESKADDDESLDTLTYGDNELAEGRGSSNRDSTGHRNMPTWSEALSGIIEGNLELHSKTPSRQSSSRGRGRSGRGGRGRGRGSKS